jgi:hypothetical protein
MTTIEKIDHFPCYKAVIKWHSTSNSYSFLQSLVSATPSFATEALLSPSEITAVKWDRS